MGAIYSYFNYKTDVAKINAKEAIHLASFGIQHRVHRIVENYTLILETDDIYGGKYMNNIEDCIHNEKNEIINVMKYLLKDESKFLSDVEHIHFRDNLTASLIYIHNKKCQNENTYSIPIKIYCGDEINTYIKSKCVSPKKSAYK